MGAIETLEPPKVTPHSDISSDVARGLYEHAEHLGEPLPPAVVAALQDEAATYVALGVERPTVSLRRWHDEWPLAAEVQAFIEAGRRVRADLDAAMEACRGARGEER